MTSPPLHLTPRAAPRSAVFLDGVNTADTNAASSAHFVNGLASTQQLADLRFMRQARLMGTRRSTAGATNYAVELMYAEAYEGSPGNFLTLGKTAISVAAATGSVIVDTGWVDILRVARKEIVVCPIFSGGDGAADPNWGVIVAWFR